MKVKELIYILQQQDPEKEVKVAEDFTYFHDPDFRDESNLIVIYPSY